MSLHVLIASDCVVVAFGCVCFSLNALMRFVCELVRNVVFVVCVLVRVACSLNMRVLSVVDCGAVWFVCLFVRVLVCLYACLFVSLRVFCVCVCCLRLIEWLCMVC